MHELGLLYETAKTVTDFAARNGISHVRSIDMEVGELTGVLSRVFEKTGGAFSRLQT